MLTSTESVHFLCDGGEIMQSDTGELQHTSTHSDLPVHYHEHVQLLPHTHCSRAINTFTNRNKFKYNK